MINLPNLQTTKPDQIMYLQYFAEIHLKCELSQLMLGFQMQVKKTNLTKCRGKIGKAFSTFHKFFMALFMFQVLCELFWSTPQN